MLKKILVISVGGIAAGLLLFWFLYKSFSYVSTDDAFIDGRIVAISPKVSAHVWKVLVDDNQKVKAGETLLELDSQDFEVRKQAAQANLQAAQAEEEQAKRDFERYQTLENKEEISKQQLDHAQLRVRTATAQVSAAQAALKQAELNVSYTKILAPVPGTVTKKSVEEGDFVQVGGALLAIVPDEMWVIANFKETELTHMHSGQKVEIKVDTYPDKVFEGHVDSIQRGTGAAFSLFPPENAAGNFVKVVQRIPVKIVFEDALDEKYPLRVGMSVVPEVKVR
jgi:membrane fusion protein (multidrug efflux system)